MKTLVLKYAVLFAVLLACLEVSAQDVDIMGAIVDDNGAVPAVSVLVEETLVETLTDAEGTYQITAPLGSTLVFSRFGYVDRKIVVGPQSRIDLIMEQEVVVVGYGIQDKEDVVVSVSKVDVEELDLGTSMGNTSNLLSGRLSGVRVVRSGEPGESPSIIIRGVRSLNSSGDPLYVVDGVVVTAGEFNSINSESIASVEVLKDAASQAIYGSRGSNGVIIITTKR